MANYSIRVDSGTIPIEVNDRGDTIILRTDAEFMKSCMRLQTDFQKGQEAYEALMADEYALATDQEAAIDKVFADTDGAIDTLFGIGACQKIFGGTTSARNAMQYVSFFDQLFKILEGQQTERAQQYVQNRDQRRRGSKKG